MDVLPVGIVSLRDESGSLGYVRVHLAASTTVETARTALSGLSALLASACAAVVVGYSVTYRTIVSEAAGGGDAGRFLLLVFVDDSGDEYAVVRVPGAPDDMFGPDGAALPGDSRVAALAASLVSGPWVSPFGVPLVSLVSALLSEDRDT